MNSRIYLLKIQSELAKIELAGSNPEEEPTGDLKEYDAPWLKDSRKVYRVGGRFASKPESVSSPEDEVSPPTEDESDQQRGFREAQERTKKELENAEKEFNELAPHQKELASSLIQEHLEEPMKAASSKEDAPKSNPFLEIFKTGADIVGSAIGFVNDSMYSLLEKMNKLMSVNVLTDIFYDMARPNDARKGIYQIAHDNMLRFAGFMFAGKAVSNAIRIGKLVTTALPVRTWSKFLGVFGPPGKALGLTLAGAAFCFNMIGRNEITIFNELNPATREVKKDTEVPSREPLAGMNFMAQYQEMVRDILNPSEEEKNYTDSPFLSMRKKEHPPELMEDRWLENLDSWDRILDYTTKEKELYDFSEEEKVEISKVILDNETGGKTFKNEQEVFDFIKKLQKRVEKNSDEAQKLREELKEISETSVNAFLFGKDNPDTNIEEHLDAGFKQIRDIAARVEQLRENNFAIRTMKELISDRTIDYGMDPSTLDRVVETQHGITDETERGWKIGIITSEYLYGENLDNFLENGNSSLNGKEYKNLINSLHKKDEVEEDDFINSEQFDDMFVFYDELNQKGREEIRSDEEYKGMKNTGETFGAIRKNWQSLGLFRNIKRQSEDLKKITNIDFSVSFTTNTGGDATLKYGAFNMSDGDADAGSNLIFLNRFGSPDQERKRIWHEMGHSIERITGSVEESMSFLDNLRNPYSPGAEVYSSDTEVFGANLKQVDTYNSDYRNSLLDQYSELVYEIDVGDAPSYANKNIKAVGGVATELVSTSMEYLADPSVLQYAARYDRPHILYGMYVLGKEESDQKYFSELKDEEIYKDLITEYAPDTPESLEKHKEELEQFVDEKNQTLIDAYLGERNKLTERLYQDNPTLGFDARNLDSEISKLQRQSNGLDITPEEKRKIDEEKQRVLNTRKRILDIFERANERKKEREELEERRNYILLKRQSTEPFSPTSLPIPSPEDRIEFDKISKRLGQLDTEEFEEKKELKESKLNFLLQKGQLRRTLQELINNAKNNE